MTLPNLDQLLEAGVHFGHQTRRWNPKMRRYIFAERNGIHIIDLQKTLRQLELAQKLVREAVLRGENILFVCTKRQLKGIVQGEAERCGAMFVTERWLGGMLTNFQTVKKQVRRLKDLEAGSEEGGDFQNYTKKEQLMMSRERDKLNKYLSGIKNMGRLPGLMFVVDSKKEKIAVTEANKLGTADRRHRRHERRSRSDLCADRRQRRCDSLGGADHEGDCRHDREARREAPKREESDGDEEGQTTYSSDRGAEPADEGEKRRRKRRPPSRQARGDCCTAECWQERLRMLPMRAHRHRMRQPASSVCRSSVRPAFDVN